MDSHEVSDPIEASSLYVGTPLLSLCRRYSQSEVDAVFVPETRDVIDNHEERDALFRCARRMCISVHISRRKPDTTMFLWFPQIIWAK